MLADAAPNVGHAFGIQTILGAGVTLLMDYSRLIGGAHAVDLLNVRYLLKPASAQEPGALYQDAGWLCDSSKNADGGSGGLQPSTSMIPQLTGAFATRIFTTPVCWRSHGGGNYRETAIAPPPSRTSRTCSRNLKVLPGDKE